MVKKGPVNIINIKNYNILKSDQKKIEREDKSSGIKRSESLKKPYKSGSSYGKKSQYQKVHNFFVFINNKGNPASKHERSSKKSPANNRTTGIDSPADQRYIKLANLLKKYPTVDRKRKTVGGSTTNSNLRNSAINNTRNGNVTNNS